MERTKSSTITITFGDQAENHVGMQKIGKLADTGFTIEDLQVAKKAFEGKGAQVEIHFLNAFLPNNVQADKEAALLIVREGVNVILSDIGKSSEDLLKEHKVLEWDTKAKMHGSVKNKNARYNLCYAEVDQEPNYEIGMGRIVAFEHLPCTGYLRTAFPTYIGDKAKNLMAEGNLYYDPSKCGIGYHGDTERRKVIAVRVGASLPLHYHWFQTSAPIGNTAEFTLHNGDLYIMSEKATGQDWKKRKIPTLRHAAGSAKYLKIKVKR